jgi:hypothetical protein
METLEEKITIFGFPPVKFYILSGSGSGSSALKQCFPRENLFGNMFMLHFRFVSRGFYARILEERKPNRTMVLAVTTIRDH